MRTCIRADVADPKMKLIRDKTRATSRDSAVKLISRVFISQPYLRAGGDIKVRGRPRKATGAGNAFSFLTPDNRRNGTAARRENLDPWLRRDSIRHAFPGSRPEIVFLILADKLVVAKQALTFPRGQ